jgi:hypothetical protein
MSCATCARNHRINASPSTTRTWHTLTPGLMADWQGNRRTTCLERCPSRTGAHVGTSITLITLTAGAVRPRPRTFSRCVRENPPSSGGRRCFAPATTAVNPA